MNRPFQLLAALAALAASQPGCDKADELDSGDGESDLQYFTGTTGGSTSEDEGCEEVEVDFDGEDPPHVGTTWTLFPRCDGALVLGAVVIRVEPLESATLDENLITFEQAGICEISVQVGSEIGTLEVEVLE